MLFIVGGLYYICSMKLFKNLAEAVREALKEIFLNGRYADKVLEKILKQNPKWGARDRRFIAETTYNMVRWWRLLTEVTVGKITHFETDFWSLFGGYLVINNQALPDWDELKGTHSQIISERLEQVKTIRKIRESVPDWLDDFGVKELGDEQWSKEIHALNEEAHVVLRVNTLKSSAGELSNQLSQLTIETSAVVDSPDALLVLKRQNLFSLPAFKEGFFELQDAASQQVAPFLTPEPGMRVIDACAGAGGKALHLAALMKNKGKIIAMDKESWKLQELKKRARRAGVSNIEIKLIDTTKVIKRLEGSADRLLLDVPCSGSGVLKRNPDAKWKLSPEQIERVKKEQQEILSNYSSMVAPGGIMVYATCSIFPAENEHQVNKFLESCDGEFALVKEKKILPSMGFDGFYLAALQKIKS